MKERYFYKTTDETSWFNLKTPDFDGVEGYEPITEQEFNAHLQELAKESE